MRPTLFGILVLLYVALAICCGDARAQEKPSADRGKALRPELTVQFGHTDSVVSVAYSPDGALVLTGSDDGTARLWEAWTGRLIRRIDGHGEAFTSVAISPDGTYLLTGSEDETACLWETVSGGEVRRFVGHDDYVTSVAFSPDGKMVLTGSGSVDRTARLWDLETGKEIRRFEGHAKEISAVCFSPDGRRVLTGSWDETMRLWETATGREISRKRGQGGCVLSVAFSPDGEYFVRGTLHGNVCLFEASTRRAIRYFQGHEGRLWPSVGSVVFSPDGTHLLTGSSDDTARLWDVATGREIRRFAGHQGGVNGVAFSPDGAYVLTGSGDGAVRLWETETGREVRRFLGDAMWLTPVAFSRDSSHIAVGSYFGTAHLWETATGREVRRLEGHEHCVETVAFSPDGESVLTGSFDETARIWSTATGEETRRLVGHEGPVLSVAYSLDGTRILTGSGDDTMRLWDAATGRELRNFIGHERAVVSVALSPDGAYALTGSDDRTARLWSVATGREALRFSRDGRPVEDVTFSPDGSHVLTAEDETVYMWETATGREVREFAGHEERVTSIAFSPDGSRILTGSWDDTARLWETAAGRELRRFVGHREDVESIAFSPDGTHILTGSADRTVRLWETATGRELCSLFSFVDGTWAVVDGEGRYDASNGGDVRGLHWVAGLDVISLDQLKSRYYDPGLLSKHLGLSTERLREVATLDRVDLYPDIQVEPPRGESRRLTVHLSNRGGGIGRVVVLVNGKEVTADARSGDVAPDAEEATVHVDLAGDPRIRPGETNSIEVHAYNAAGYLRSRGLGLSFDAPGESTYEPPHLWAIVCGVSDYRGEAIDLRFAAKDAEDFAVALRLAAAGLLGEERVHLALLTTSGTEGTTRPTRANLERAFEAARQSRPDDLLVVYLSGHGVTVAGQDGDYHYLLAEAASADLTDPALRKLISVSSTELTEMITRIPAAKRQVLILDTCASGRLVEKLTETRTVPGNQVRALERLKDRTGMFVLAGCAADRVSYEASRYGQGLLTYSLLLGMRGAALREGEFVDVQRLVGFAQDRVPELARDIGGIQRPVVALPRGGGSFDIGRLTEAARAKVPLRTPRPLLGRANFQEEELFDDVLGLTRAVHAALRNISARGAEAPLVFVDATGVAGAYRLVGRYGIEGERVRVTVRVFYQRETVFTFDVEGARTGVASLADAIVGKARGRLEEHLREQPR